MQPTATTSRNGLTGDLNPMELTMSEVHLFSVRNPISNLHCLRVYTGPSDLLRFEGTIVRTDVAFLPYCNSKRQWLAPCQSAREALDVLLSA